MYKDIIKALRIHSKTVCCECQNCPYYYKDGWGTCSDRMAQDAADAIEKLQEDSVPIDDMEMILSEVVKPRWIPVTERLPDQGESVLVYRRGDNRVQPKMRIDVCPYLGDGIFCLIDVAYWMPLPEPPKEG